jgi:hypothetical protein
MNKQREALQMALDALSSDNQDIMLRASFAIREALAEPEQEPVAWRHWIYVDGEKFPQLTLVPRTDKDEPLYAAPPARKPLSYMEACTFIALNIEGGAESLEMQSQLVDLIRAVERAHGIRGEE